MTDARLVATDLSSHLDRLRATIDEALARAVGAPETPPLLAEAMRYAALGGGKRLRPCLTLLTAECAGAPLDVAVSDAHALALPAAVAIEMIHSYSLVHDDLPAMDDDTMRRGRETTHVVYGDGMAILSGDALLTDAFAVLADPPAALIPAGARRMSVERQLRAIARLATAAGSSGMVGGQAIDVTAAGRVPGHALGLDAASLRDMHARKTGALICAAVTLGAIAVGAGDRTIAALDDYARELGLAFQIADDLLDIEGTTATLGKTAGKDAAAGKPTYPALFGADASRRLMTEAVARAKAALAQAGLHGRLAAVADWSVERRR